MKKRIFCIGPLSSGHLQKWIYPFINDYDFIFFTLHDTKLPNEFDGFKKYVVPRITNTRIDFLLAYPYLQFLILKYAPDVLYVSFLSSYGLLSAFTFSKCNRFLSVWGTDVNGKPQKNFFIRWLVRLINNKFVYVNAPAEHIKMKLINLGFEKNKIKVFQYGVDFSRYSKKVINILNPKQKTIKFLSVRNWDELYNITSVIRGYSIFCQNSKVDTELTIIGKEGQISQHMLTNLIDSLSFNNGKVNVIGFVAFAEMNELLVNHDVVISVPSMDGTPLSLLEAMYVGLLPLVSDIDANREWLDEECAIFSEPDELQFAFEKSLYFINDDKKLIAALERNRINVTRNANYVTNTEKLDRLFFKQHT